MVVENVALFQTPLSSLFLVESFGPRQVNDFLASGTDARSNYDVVRPEERAEVSFEGLLC